MLKSLSAERSISALALAPLLLVSGGCALMFQVIWIKEFRLIFGATTAASSVVMAIFMGGLGIGNAILGRRVDHMRQPLRLYGLLEAGIAVSAFCSPWLIDLVRFCYIGIGGQEALGQAAATVVRLLAAVFVLAVPTFLMGGTLPAAAAAVSTDSDEARRSVAFLYGINTLGAVVGAGLANFFLLEALGTRGVLWLAFFANAFLATVALGLSRKITAGERQQRTKTENQAISPPPKLASSRIRLVCLVSALVGFSFFLMEIVWYRMLGPLLGGTTYTFGLILCVALFGIGLGGALYSGVARWLKPSLTVLSITCALEAFLIAVPYWWGDNIALWVLNLQSMNDGSFAEHIVDWFRVGAFVVLPPAVIAGFQFPLLIAIAGSGHRDVGRDVGLTFASNTLGAILGSLAGGFWLLPILTAPGVWRAVVLILTSLALLILVMGTRWRPVSVTTVLATAILSCAMAFAEGPTAVWRHSAIGAGRANLERGSRNAEQDFMNSLRRQCIWEAEGIESSVAITATDSLAFIVNGKSDGNAYGDAGTQIGLGLLGPVLHKSARQVLVIGLGTGESAGWAAAVEGVESVDVVELEPSIVEMARRCRTVNCDVLNNPHFQLHDNDAREYLLTTKQSYDCIVSEPSNPYRAGIATLYTREFYESAANRLTQDGLFLQWLQGYEVDERTVAIVLQTMKTVFPEIQVWRTKARDMVLVCSKSPNAFRYDSEDIQSRLRKPTIAEGLDRAWGVRDVEGVLAHFVCGTKTIDRLLSKADHRTNTDDRNLLEFAFAKTLGRTTHFSIEKLQNLSVELQDDIPMGFSSVDAEIVWQRRLAMHLMLGEAIPSEMKHPPSQQARADAYRLYLQNQTTESAAQFQQLTIDLRCPIETSVYAHLCATAGLPIDEELLGLIENRNPPEASALRAVISAQQDEQEAARDSVIETFALLRSQPWISSQLLDDVLRITAALAEANPADAPKLYRALDRPFAMSRLEDKRLLLRYLVSEHGEPKDQIAALSALEPNIPWKLWFLRDRAALYTTANHPLAPIAERDLQLFQNWAAETE